MKRYGTALALAALVAFGLACAGAETQSTSLPSTAAPGAQGTPGGAKKLSKPLDTKQAAAAKQVGAAKAKNGTPSPDGAKKLQVERKKKKEPSGEIVWVIVEEWVDPAEWHDEIWVVDAFIDEDDVLLVELDDFDAALVEELVALEVEAFEQVLAEEIVGAIVEEAALNEVARELAEAEEE